MAQRVEDTKIYRELLDRKSEFLHTIDGLIPIVKERLETQVPKLFPEFTIHNIHHSIRVSDYIFEILGSLKSFNDLELTLMLLGALLHDLGMAIGTDDLHNIHKDTFFDGQEVEYAAYKKVYGERADQEIVRKFHAEISSLLIGDPSFPAKFTVSEPRGVSYVDDLRLLCESHTKDFLWIRERLPNHNVIGVYDYNLRFLSHLLRIADLLDIDQSRTPFELYRLISPQGRSDEEWLQHFVVTNTKKIEFDQGSNTRKVVLYGKSDNIKIHRKLLSYIKWIDEEIGEFIKYTEDLRDTRFKVSLSGEVDRKIATVGFTVSDYRLSLDFSSITELLMGDNIYGDKKLGLREIVQNSIDATLVMNEVEKKQTHDYVPTVRIEISTKDNLFTIADNGIGMSEDIIKKFFLNIGKSYYRSDIYRLNNFSYSPIGYFGIGFLACFMLSDEVVINTRHHTSRSRHTINLEKGNEYIGFNSVEDVAFFGTEIQLKLDQVMANFEKSTEAVKAFLLKYFVTDNFTLKLTAEGQTVEIAKSVLAREEQASQAGAKTSVVVMAAKYLKDVFGFVQIRNKHSFIRDVGDLRARGDKYFYIEDGVVTRGQIDFTNIVNQGQNTLKYLHLPLYDDSDNEEFAKVLEILDDDLDATIEKVDSAIDLYVFFPVSVQEELDYQNTYREELVYVHDAITLEQVLGEEFSEYFCPKIKVVELNLIGNDRLNLLEVYKPLRESFYSREKQELFLRNILVNQYSFGKVFLAETVGLLDFRINYLGKELMPDISRNNLLPSSRNVLNNSLNLMIHLAALEEFDFLPDEKALVMKFIREKLLSGAHLVRKEVLLHHGIIGETVAG